MIETIKTWAGAVIGLGLGLFGCMLIACVPLWAFYGVVCLLAKRNKKALDLKGYVLRLHEDQKSEARAAAVDPTGETR